MEAISRFPEGLTAYLLTGAQSVFSYTGFYTGAFSPKQIGPYAAIVTRDKIIFAAPANWSIQICGMVSSGSVEFIFYSGGAHEFYECVCSLLKREQVSDVSIEWNSIGLALYKKLSAVFPSFSFKDIAGALEFSRFKKTKAEIACLIKAAGLAVTGMERAKEVLREGISENEVVAELEYAMRIRGSEGVPFAIKVLSGEKSAHTTFMPGDKIIERGDLVLLDFGARWGHYASDWTRTFCIGPASPEQKELYQTVWDIERSCISMAAPGVKLKDLYDNAFSMVRGGKYEKYFLPHLGHSVGINSHEMPVIEPGVGSGIVLEEDMEITIEPGIYIPGFGGVRIEDDILITPRGCEILTGLTGEGLELL